MVGMGIVMVGMDGVGNLGYVYYGGMVRTVGELIMVGMAAGGCWYVW